MAQYIFSKGSDGQSGKTKGSFFIIGRVKSIVLGPEYYDGRPDPNYASVADIGKIIYEIMYTNINISKAEATAQPAYPIFSAIKQFPLISEIVLIIPGPDSDLNDSINRQGYYYFPPYSLWNSINHNAFPNMEEYSEYLKQYYTKPGIEGTDASQNVPSLPIGNTFNEKGDIRPIRIFEGDTILEGRFGQSLRFGSTNIKSSGLNNWSKSGEPNSPITIIKNGQGNVINPDKFSSISEDFNRDNTSIWMTSGQELTIENIQRFPMRSFEKYNRKISKTNFTKTLTSTNNTKYSSSPSEQDKKSIG